MIEVMIALVIGYAIHAVITNRENDHRAHEALNNNNDKQNNPDEPPYLGDI